MLSALTIDLEDYYNASVFDSIYQRHHWPNLESRVEASTETVLELLAHHHIKATFFVLGWVAERHQNLVKAVCKAGHEIGSHGFHHELTYSMTRDHYRQDVRRSKQLLEDLTGSEVVGYRAPSYTITTQSLWALDILVEESYQYDSSIFPIHHDRYGIPGAERFPYVRSTAAGKILEFPPSTVRLLRRNLPVAGGAYLRILPYAYIRWGLRQITTIERKPAIVYFHPWELDGDQPRVTMGLFSRFRHYTNLTKMRSKLEHLFADFEFGPVRAVAQSLRLSGAAQFDYGR
ncbi:MAG: DUF3473 domain-containing protein [Acidobacteria bacterium]|nr:DUF3473 domain-containing protein [Acidobacteriota bacterium]MBI3655283.1 DUF3473 domain-containing protein [Acidobacteriota bacterium]